MSDITTATGLTKGSIYGNFANKDEVALAVFDYNLQQVNAIVLSEMGKCTTFREKLLVYITVYDNFSSCLPDGGCPILNTAIEADDTHPGLRSKANNAINAWKTKIMQLINKGIAAKEFNAQTDAEAIALHMIATIEGAIMLAKLTGKTSYRKTVLDSLKMTIENL